MSGVWYFKVGIQCLGVCLLFLFVNLKEILHGFGKRLLLVGSTPCSHNPVVIDDMERVMCGPGFWLVSCQSKGDVAFDCLLFLWVVGG